MSNLYHPSLPVSQAQFRDNTDKRAVMLNAQRTPKKAKCCRCHTHRTEATGKHTDKGFVCHGCGKST